MSRFNELAPSPLWSLNANSILPISSMRSLATVTRIDLKPLNENELELANHADSDRSIAYDDVFAELLKSKS